jgi:hypothetical protein
MKPKSTLSGEIPPGELDELKALIAAAGQHVETSAVWSVQRLKSCMEVGRRFTDIKKRLKHGAWLRWLESGEISLHRNTAAKWMKLAKMQEQGKIDPSNARSIREAYTLAGIIPGTDGSHAKSYLRQKEYMLHATRLRASLERLDMSALTDERRNTLIGMIEPICEILGILKLAGRRSKKSV